MNTQQKGETTEPYGPCHHSHVTSYFLRMRIDFQGQVTNDHADISWHLIGWHRQKLAFDWLV